MIERQLEWLDINYFSKGVISSSNNGTLTIVVNKDLSPVEFVHEFLAAASTAELTLNSVREADRRGSNFPIVVETQPVLNEETGNYSKIMAYNFNFEKILTREEVEGDVNNG